MMIVTENPAFQSVHIHIEYLSYEARFTVDGIEILDEKIVYQNGPFCRVQRWLRGVHPHLGILIRGYTGWETFVETDVIRPSHTFTVVDAPLEHK
jgi:hypothetical protein